MMAMDMETSLDVAVLVGELPEIPCEEPNHGRARNHGGPATHYWRWLHGCSMPAGTVIALCSPKTNAVHADLAAGMHGRCRICGGTAPLPEVIEFIGPIGGRS